MWSDWSVAQEADALGQGEAAARRGAGPAEGPAIPIFPVWAAPTRWVQADTLTVLTRGRPGTGGCGLPSSTHWPYRIDPSARMGGCSRRQD